MPPYTEAPDGSDVAAFVGKAGDQALIVMADQHAAAVMTLARSYTRGRGFDPVTGDPAEDIAAAVLTAAARLVDNPTQLERYTLGMETHGFTPFLGWSLVETLVLNRYRKRAL